MGKAEPNPRGKCDHSKGNGQETSRVKLQAVVFWKVHDDHIDLSGEPPAPVLEVGITHFRSPSWRGRLSGSCVRSSGGARPRARQGCQRACWARFSWQRTSARSRHGRRRGGQEHAARRAARPRGQGAGRGLLTSLGLSEVLQIQLLSIPFGVCDFCQKRARGGTEATSSAVPPPQPCLRPPTEAGNFTGCYCHPCQAHSLAPPGRPASPLHTSPLPANTALSRRAQGALWFSPHPSHPCITQLTWRALPTYNPPPSFPEPALIHPSPFSPPPGSPSPLPLRC